jgi:tRNA(Ile)-lysidine synthase
MLAGGERVLVAVSGGADSVALLHVLVALAPSLGVTLHVAHVDHRLRPDSARDAEFVAALAHRLRIPVEILPVDVSRVGSPEAAARVARYAALEACAGRLGLDRIAIAHTADDQAETVLMRVMEGAGPRGLAGIPPVRGRIIRPLIETRRADIVSELTRGGLSWVEDPSNLDRRFLRNRIRHDLLPALGRENPDIVAALGRTALLARETIEAVERMATLELERSAVPEGAAIVLPVQRLRALPPSVAAEALRQVAARLGSRAPLRAWAYRGLARVVVDPPPRRGFRLGGVTVEVSAGYVRLGRTPAPLIVSRAVAVPGTTAIPEIGLGLVAVVVDATDYLVPRDRRTAAFDADLLPSPVRLRARARGDRFTPFGGGGERQLKHFFISAKVPRWRRSAVPLIEAGGEILWVAGHRRGAAAPISSATRRIVELSLVPLAEVGAGR